MLFKKYSTKVRFFHASIHFFASLCFFPPITRNSHVPTLWPGQNLSSKPENDDKTLQELAIVANSKLMLMGSEPAKVIEAAMVSTSSNVSNDFDAAAAKAKEVWSEQDTHKKIIEKGIPTDAEPGELNRHAPVLHPISNLLNNRGTKVRLTLKTDTNEVWINSAASTQKYPMGAIREVQSQPIKGHEQYHLMYFQMGKDDSPNLRLWFYWVPAQYVRAIRGMILGTWF
jgi:hypothetical protein